MFNVGKAIFIQFMLSKIRFNILYDGMFRGSDFRTWLKWSTNLNFMQPDWVWRMPRSPPLTEGLLRDFGTLWKTLSFVVVLFPAKL